MLFKKYNILFSLIFTHINLTSILTQNQRINNFNQLNNYFIKLGLSTASNICKKYTRSNLRQTCNSVVNQSSYLDFNAVFLCENIFFISTNTINCLDSISNKSYTDSELLKCGNSTNKFKIYTCLENSGKTVNQNQLNYEYENKIAFKNAQNICNSFTNSSTKTYCNKIINNSYFLDVDAVSLCRTKFSISPKILNCFQIITNKTYTFSNLFECNQQLGEAKILSCLSTNGYLLKNE
jgi:hypothetical protein